MKKTSLSHIKTPILSLIVLLLLWSCNGIDKDTLIEGQVVDIQTGDPLSEICLTFYGYRKNGIMPDEIISVHRTSVEADGRFKLSIFVEDVDFYSSSIYRKKEGICTTNPMEMEFLNFDCGSSECNSLIKPGKKHNFLFKVDY